MGRTAAALALGLALASLAAPAGAQTYARFAVPDSALAGALTSSGGQFEVAWNALLVAELRATLAGADSAARLARLAKRVADAEPGALGSHIAGDALHLRSLWSPDQRRLRVRAAVAESIGAAALGARDLARADSLHREALGAYRRLGERRRVAWVWGSLGSAAFLRGDMVGADSLYRQALATRKAIGDLRMVGNALNTLGSVAFSLHRYDHALAFYREARAAREQTGERAALGTTLNNLGNVAAAKGLADSAAAYYRTALDLTMAMADSGRTREVLNNYGLLLMRGKDPAAALPLFERALAILRERGDRPAQADVLINMGDLLRQQGHYGESAARLDEARELTLELGDPRLLRVALLNIGRVAIGVGDAAAARPPLERALAIADSLSDAVGQTQALNDLAITADLAGDPKGAERLAARALAAAEAAGDSSLVHDAAASLGQLASDRGDLDAADRWFHRAAAAGAIESSQRLVDVFNLGAVAALSGRLDEAERHFRGALEESERRQSPDFAWPALLGLGDVAERRGADAVALGFDRQAAAMIEDLRARQGSERPSVALLAQRLYAFEALIHLLTRLQPRYPDSAYAAEAFHWSERARARAFLDLVAATGGEARRFAPLTLRAAQGLLPTDRVALLAYSVGDSSTSLWVVKRRAWAHFTLPPRRALRARIEILRRGLANIATADAPAAHSAARALYRTLIEPALPMLKGVDHLVIAPDGPLALVPFEALLARDADAEGPPPRGAWLVERYAISYTPSASALATRAGTSPAPGIVAVGDPTFAPDSAATTAGIAPMLPRLSHTAAEVAALTALAGGRPVQALTGREATRERLLALPGLSRAALIHIATHGVSNEVEPERSGLWLAAAPGADAPGFVSVPDILRLRLSADLVTLSACETGLGRVERGEGVVGLGRAFLAAGAQSVLVSLWKVNDYSTAQLMERFYRGLIKDGSTGAAALAQAKRAMLRNVETRSPFYWAPFVLVGGAGRLSG